MASWQKFSHAETARPRDARTKIAFCPQGLPSRTGRVWASCVALYPHTQVTLCSTCTPVTRRGGGGLCRFNSDTNSTSRLPCFVHGKKLRGSLTDHCPSPSQTRSVEASLRLEPKPGIREEVGLRAAGHRSEGASK